jgi:hypothetical protein
MFRAGDLVFDSAGNLYGATLFGGGRGTNCNDLYGYCGTIFELSPANPSGAGSWKHKILYSFQGIGPASTEGDGGNPNGGLIFDENGAIYGTTYYGGSNIPSCQPQGCGTIFELIPPRRQGGFWAEEVLHRFQNRPTDGFGPNGNLILSKGVLYGTTVGGGGGEVGILYSLGHVKGHDHQWLETILYTFLGDPNPNNPVGGLTVTKDGYILGTANSGGAFFGGSVYQLMPPAKPGTDFGLLDLLDLYNFADSPDGAAPIGNMVSNGGTRLYGMTQVGGTGQACQGGCGTVYKVWP